MIFEPHTSAFNPDFVSDLGRRLPDRYFLLTFLSFRRACARALAATSFFFTRGLSPNLLASVAGHLLPRCYRRLVRRLPLDESDYPTSPCSDFGEGPACLGVLRGIDLTTQQELADTVPHPRQVDAQVFTTTDQVAKLLLVWLRDAHQSEPDRCALVGLTRGALATCRRETVEDPCRSG